MPIQSLHRFLRSFFPQSLYNTYKFRVKITNARKFKSLLIFFPTLYDFLFRRKTILFYPDEPLEIHILYKIIRFLGHRIISDPSQNFDLAFLWWRSFEGIPYAPENTCQVLADAAKKNNAKILNIRCNDVSKILVIKCFEEAFGYSISVDPEKYNGKCVMKSNGNGLHIGGILDCPTTRADGFVYQKIINNETKEGLVEDMRVPIYNDTTPFIYLKYRSVDDRLVDRVHTNTKATIARVSDYLSEEELKKIYLFAHKIGMDCGEVDVLRDQNDGQIYIVDANNFPSGPPSPISDEEGNRAVLSLSKTFAKVF